MSTHYTKSQEGLSSITGSDIWSTACNSTLCDTFDLSYNNFTNTTLSALDFRLNDGDAFEDRVKYLDLSHNQIIEVSFEVFRYPLQDDDLWTLYSLDLSYNQITDLSSFPSHNRGSLKRLLLQHNQITQLGNPDPTALYAITRDDFEELNLEFNKLTEMPWLLFDGAISYADINVRNNLIHNVTLPYDPITGYYWLRVVNFENNQLTAFTFEMIDQNYDTQIFNFNNNMLTQISAFTPSDPTNAYYEVRELYFNNNEIVSIATSAFDLFNKLEILEVTDNKIAAFPFANIFDTAMLPNLTIVNLVNNELVMVENRTGDFPRNPTQQLNVNVKGRK